MLITILIILAYLLGSIPSAVWIGKRFYGIDVREHGSKNAGATNTLRVLGRRAALPVFIIDSMKGFVAVKLSGLTDIIPDSNEMFFLKIVLTIVVVAGHIFPIFARFKGGKGVATMAGAILAVATMPLLLALATFTIVLLISKYVSLSSMIGGISLPFYCAFVFNESLSMVIFSILIAITLIITHKKNIKRLIRGQESKIYIFKKQNKK